MLLQLKHFLKNGEYVIAILNAFLVHFMFWNNAVPDRNGYDYVFKISEPQVDRLKESYLEELKDDICQKVTKISPNLTFGLFANL